MENAIGLGELANDTDDDMRTFPFNSRLFAYIYHNHTISVVRDQLQFPPPDKSKVWYTVYTYKQRQIDRISFWELIAVVQCAVNKKKTFCRCGCGVEG